MFNIKWSFLPQLVYFLLTIMRGELKLTKFDIFVYFGVPIILFVSAFISLIIPAPLIPSSLPGWEWLSFFLVYMGAVCLGCGIILAILRFVLNKIKLRNSTKEAG
ncbi:hypothetical protein VA599_05985 [Chromobacterium sp. TRC.1.1.SA]|uniref:Uncharacterized protein n=1 Tax=Chromobacterium indicum TaxID=3110228 RepID=A0ABV0CJW4_9NEIS